MNQDTTPGPQHLRALARANEVRLARAELKRQVHAGEVSAADVILESAWEAESMTVADLLMAQRRWGHTRCRTFLQRIPMSETKTVGSMTDRQRNAVAQLLAANESAGVTVRHGRERTLEPALA
jgi:hypothetical protein